MAQRQTKEQLGVKPGEEIIVKGQVSFARLDKLVDGDALEKENQRRAKLGMMTADKPFRSITIENPQIVKGDGTPLATFYGQTVYTSKSGAPSMSLESKSLYAPGFGHLQNNKIVEIEDPQANPNKGQEVYLLIRAFQPKNFNKMGSTFESIVYGEGPIDFYNAGSSLAGFGEALGLEVQPLSQTQPQPVQNDNQGGFGGQQEQAPTQGAFGGNEQQAPQQNAFGGFGGGGQQQAPQQDSQAQDNPFGVQDSDLSGGGSPFGGGPASGGGVNSPYA